MSNRITPDKWRHFYAGILMGLVFEIALLWLFTGHPYLATAVALLLVLAISYGFELFSKITGKGIYDFADAVASVIGGVTGMVLAIGGLALTG